MKTSIHCFIYVGLIFGLSFSCYAETRYIADQLVVTVRSNKAQNYDVITTLLTDSPVEILEEDADFVKVRTAKGIEGYIKKQYVTKAIPKSLQIAELKTQKAALEQQLQKQRQSFQTASSAVSENESTIAELSAELEETKSTLEKVRQEYSDLQERSENVLNLTTERDQLLEENNQMQSELEVLQEENADFHRSNMIQWFLAGGGVFFGGWLAGKISRKKRGYSRF